MITSAECFLQLGNPATESTMVLWVVPKELRIPAVPKKIYCNQLLVGPLSQAFKNLIIRGLESELKTWDGCFNIRKMVGLQSMSLHSWGLAIDVNAAWNQLHQPPSLSPEFVQAFKDAGFDWGGDFKGRTDGMHFQAQKL